MAGLVRLGPTVVVAAAAVTWLASLVITVIDSPSGARVSSDPRSAPVAYWVTLLPVAVGIALALVLPPRSPRRPVSIRGRRPFAATTSVLVVLAVLFPVLTSTVPLEGESYVVGKLLLFMIVPGVLLLVVRRGVRIEWNRDASRWWAPAIVIVAWTVLSQVAPWNPAFDADSYDPVFLIVAATATAITAGVGEELFFRRWLQTRIEAAAGAWPGIALASLAFALMHLGSHGAGQPLLDVARVIVVQGSFGLFLGVLWWRFRNLLAIVVVHIVANGWGVAAAVVAG